MARLTFHRHADVDAFLAAGGRFLEAREAEHNLILGVAGQVRSMPGLFTDGAPSFATVHDADGRVVAATLRTPPWNQVLSRVEDPDAVDLLADGLRDEALPGLVGPKAEAARFVARWVTLTGQRSQLEMAERVFRLDRVVPPSRPAAGSWRLAEPGDRALLVDWFVAFHDEATPEAPVPDDVGAMVDRYIAQAHRALYVWVDANRVVCMVGAGGETAHGIRIGPVYTPSELRERGYASSLTAAASQDQLDRGRAFVTLFTDLANPTSNKIYQAIGYRPICDVDMYRLGGPPPGGS
jgi:uncharacterized protein